MQEHYSFPSIVMYVIFNEGESAVMSSALLAAPPSLLARFDNPKQCIPACLIIFTPPYL